ncbi:MAG: hypothetical protein GXO37_03430, partial [Chloroflexi bacterium]|nr:hypothetical protein [Chloroflexota bacterium]
CQRAAASPSAVSPTRPAEPTRRATRPPTATVTVTPSATPIPVAARVNGEAILVAEWVAETRRALAAAEDLGLALSPSDAGEQALDLLVERLLWAQAAREQGLFPGEDEVQARWQQLEAARGGAEAWAAYLADLGYTPATFRQALAQDMAAARMRMAVAEQVPTHGPQVKARVIHMPTQADAQAVLQYLHAGEDFMALVRQYHPTGRGDLGWFPRGALWVPEVEEAAFALEPGHYSAVIPTDRGFYIVYVEARSDDRPYAPWALDVLRARAVAEFLAQRRAAAQIEILVNPQEPPLSGP